MRRTARSLKALAREGRGLLHSAGEDVFELSVSAAAPKPGGRMPLKLQGERFRLQIGEPSERSERELVREEVKLKREGKLC